MAQNKDDLNGIENNSDLQIENDEEILPNIQDENDNDCSLSQSNNQN